MVALHPLHRLCTRMCRRLHISWLRTRHAQLACAAASWALSQEPGTALYLGVTLARAAALRCQIAALLQQQHPAA